LTRNSAIAEEEQLRKSRSYCILWTSCATCWQWLFQTWKFLPV